jgi:hypothetical protein
MAARHSKWTTKLATFSIPSPSKIYQKWDFGFVNILSGNPGDPSMRLSNRAGSGPGANPTTLEFTTTTPAL